MAAQDLRTKQFLYAQRNSEGHSSSRESPSLSAVFDFFDDKEIDVPLLTTDGVSQAQKDPKIASETEPDSQDSCLNLAQ